MKRIVVLIGYILIAELVYSQSFISETKLWSNVVHGTEYGSPYVSFYIKMTIDSVISGNSYGKVYRSNDSLQLNWFIEGLIRETDTGTVYYRDVEDDTETLLYDFGVIELDSIQAIEGEDYFFYVDSIRIKPFGIYNELRKHIYLSADHIDNTETWIEGVGSLIGVLSDLSFHLTVGEARGLLCFTENDSLKYNPSNSCFISGIFLYSEQIDNNRLIEVKNNAGELIIKSNGAQCVRICIKIFDLKGRQFFAREVSNRETLNLSTLGLPNGLYIYQIQGGGSFKTGKFLIY
ncbi:MAG: T9SS type A sorting domain-containing protein [Bacteroidales bacterium]|nr:T9SS type A sorting domain-containing protein [Bacteroidales bacterium]